MAGTAHTTHSQKKGKKRRKNKIKGKIHNTRHIYYNVQKKKKKNKKKGTGRFLVFFLQPYRNGDELCDMENGKFVYNNV